MAAPNKVKTQIFIFLAVIFAFATSCEMEDETTIEPNIVFNFPTNNQQIMKGADVKIIAQLLGFSEYVELKSVTLSIDDSIVQSYSSPVETIEYTWKTNKYTGNSHNIKLSAEYTDQTPQKKDWNYFNARDYIEDEKEPAPENLTLSKSISIKIIPFKSGSPAIQYSTLPRDTFSYSGKTIVLDSFKISKYEITTSQYVSFLNAIDANGDGSYGNIKYIFTGKTSNITHNGNQFISKEGRDSLPATNVTWLGAQNYCKWAGGKLPTQAEWYYATNPDSIGGTGFILNEVAWFRNNSNKKIHKIGTKKSNSHGIYDMLGNAAEYCLDGYSNEAFPSGGDTLVNPLVSGNNEVKIYKGGHWNAPASETNIKLREPISLTDGRNYIGFRIVQPLN